MAAVVAGSVLAGLVVLGGVGWGAWQVLSHRRSGDPRASGGHGAALHIRSVTEARSGTCPSGGPGVGGTENDRPVCYRLGEGMTVHQVRDASAEYEKRVGGWQVNLRLNDADTRAFADLTRRYAGRRLAIVSGDRVISAPTVTQPIVGGALVITGDLTRDEAEKLARSLAG